MDAPNNAWRCICEQGSGDFSSLIYIYNLTGKRKCREHVRKCREHVVCKIVFWKQSGTLCHYLI